MVVKVTSALNVSVITNSSSPLILNDLVTMVSAGFGKIGNNQAGTFVSLQFLSTFKFGKEHIFCWKEDWLYIYVQTWNTCIIQLTEWLHCSSFATVLFLSLVTRRYKMELISLLRHEYSEALYQSKKQAEIQKIKKTFAKGTSFKEKKMCLWKKVKLQTPRSVMRFTDA